MTDAHCHRRIGEGRLFLCSPTSETPRPDDALFIGIHPWEMFDLDEPTLERRLAQTAARLDPETVTGVGEIGLDRLKARTIPPLMRRAFERQLNLAAERELPVVLHGAKCWGEVVKTIDALFGRTTRSIPACLFHGFSRSDGLLPDIIRLNGFISVGPAVLNDHAVNYRALVAKIPLDRLLVETDATDETAADAPGVEAVAAKVAALRGLDADEFAAVLERNAERFAPRRIKASEA